MSEGNYTEDTEPQTAPDCYSICTYVSTLMGDEHCQLYILTVKPDKLQKSP